MLAAFECIDYGGKTRLISRVMAHLLANDVDYLSVREPGGFSNLLRDYAINECGGEHERAIMMAADRILTHNKLIKPYLKRNQDKRPLILSDRCYLTSLVYQGAMVNREVLFDISEMHDRLFAEGALVAPDIIFIIRPNINDIIERMTNAPKDGKLDATETLDHDVLVARDKAYSEFAEGGLYDDMLDHASPKIVEIFETDLDKQLDIVMEHINTCV